MEAARAELLRNKYTPNATFGKLIVYGIDGSVLFSCHTLEDTVRPIGIKVKHYTAIYSGLYEITVNKSPKFGRKLPFIIGSFGFVGIRIHSGKDADSTSGCPIVGTSVNHSKETISGGSSIIDELTRILDGKTLPFEVKNGFQVG